MHRVSVFLVSSLLMVGAAAADDAARPVSPILEWSEVSLERFDASWLHVKFVEGSDVRLVAAPTASGRRFADAEGGALPGVDAALAAAVAMRRTFPGDRAKFRAWKTRGEAASGRPGPDLALWFDVKLAGDRAALANALDALNALPEIEIAHPAPIPEPAVVLGPTPVSPLALGVPALTGGTPDFTDLQTYLYDTPIGLDAPSAWAWPGGRGAGMKFIDVEQGWVREHEDFDQALFFHENGVNSFGDHGTAVLGEVVGVDNGFGVVGFAGDAQWGTVGYDIGEWPDLPHRFLEAVEALDAGDVWLIEIQMFPEPIRDPMEWLQVNYDVIWTGSWSLGVICVEAGANGGQNLDDVSWDGVFDREIRDSGAIMVAAGTPFGRSAESFTNYGSRMDVNAWGSAIVTTGYGFLYSGGSRETEYTNSFGGTSGASPMIVGSALCLQGIALESLGSPLWPSDLRALLRDTGIDHLGSRLIGPRPDLGAAAEQLLGRACPEDLDRSDIVDFGDLLLLLSAWGPCEDCPEDLDGNDVVDFGDVLLLLSAWGPCPAAELGACCFATSCINTLEQTCTVEGGAFQGTGTRCRDGCPIPADSCESAPITGDGTYPYSTRNATTDGPFMPAECDEGNGPWFRQDVWITYVAPCDGTALASICDSDFDNRLAVYEGRDCVGAIVACSDDACGADGTRAEVAFPVQAGAEYLVRIGSVQAGGGDGVLTMRCDE